jgi:protein ImuA
MGTLIGNARLRELLASRLEKKAGGAFRTGYAALDALLPDDGLPRGAVHEVIPADDRTPPTLFALVLARAAIADNGGAVVWSDRGTAIYPPALAMMGVPVDRMFLLRAGKPSDEVWALTECLRCRGVAATVASPPRLSSVEARRLQLAAERGGGIGVLVRRRGGASAHYAAATRWVVSPMPGDAGVQRWGVELVHGHGRLATGRSVVLEVCRGGTNHVRAIDVLADRPGLAPPVAARATA